MKQKHRVKILFKDGNEYAIEARDATKHVRVSINKWDWLNGKKGDEAHCALANAVNREDKLFPHPVHGACTFKRRCFVVTKLNQRGEPTHGVRYDHEFDVKEFDITASGFKERSVLLRVISGRDRYGHRPKAKPRKAPGKPNKNKAPYQISSARGLHARGITQKAWIQTFIAKHGEGRVPA